MKIDLLDTPTAVEIRVDGSKRDIACLKEPIRLRAGKHELEVASNNFETLTQSFTVRRGDTETLHISFDHALSVKASPSAAAAN